MMSAGRIPSALSLSLFCKVWAIGVAKNLLEKLLKAPQRLEEQNRNAKELVLSYFYFKPNTRILRNLIHGVEHLGVIHSTDFSEAQDFSCI